MNTNARAVVMGAASGAAMLACLIVGATRAGMPWEWPIRWIFALLGAAPGLISVGQAHGGLSTPSCIAIGLAIHAIISTLLARLFLLLVAHFKKPYRAPAGLLYGAILWAIMTYALLPMADGVMAARVQLIPQAFLIANLVFGTVLGACATLVRGA